MAKSLDTAHGMIHFPAYIPVTTFGKAYPLDQLVRPYLPRLAQAVMVSAYYARDMTKEERPSIPLLVDSGGFAALFKHSKITKKDGLGILEILKETQEKEIITPQTVLQFQEEIGADIAFSLDFPIPPNTSSKEQKKRFELTIKNALWALENKRNKGMRLFACLQAWDGASAREGANIYADYPFDGVAIGGLVPRAKDMEKVLKIVKEVRNVLPQKPIHVFGLGKPEIVHQLFEAGVSSVDSSSYVKMAAEGKLWQQEKDVESPTTMDRLHLALCNLAYATGKSMPLSAYNLGFSTLNLLKN